MTPSSHSYINDISIMRASLRSFHLSLFIASWPPNFSGIFLLISKAPFVRDPLAEVTTVTFCVKLYCHLLKDSSVCVLDIGEPKGGFNFNRIMRTS